MLSANDKRAYSREGFLLADAVLATAGELPYLRKEFGLPGDPNEQITLTRTKETLEKALDTFAGKPITIDHPKPFLDTGNATEKAVGAVSSTPTIDAEGNVRAKVAIWDKDAIRRVEMGQTELSPGFLFLEPEIINGKGNIENMVLNHVALTPHGRAGPAVRIMDSLPAELIGVDTTKTKEALMPAEDENKIAEAIRQAIDGARKSKSDIAEAVDAAVKPLVEEVAALKAKDAKAESEAKMKEAKDAADADRQKAVDAAVKGERDRYKIIEDAKPFIATDSHDGLLDMEAKEILKLAVGEDAATDDLSEMRGILKGMKIAADKGMAAAPASGVVERGGVKLTQAEDARAKKYAAQFAEGRG